MSGENPFLVPKPARKPGVEAGSGLDWLKQGWALFMRNPGVWVGIALIAMVGTAVVAVIPLIGQLATNLVWPVLTGGLMAGCRTLTEGGELRLSHLFDGFRDRAGELFMVGVLWTLGVLAIAVAAMLIAGGGAFSAAMIGNWPGAGMAVGGLAIGLLFIGLATVPLMMALWFAPALVMLRGMRATDALKASFSACLRNPLPLLLYGVLLVIATFVAMLPMGLGLLVLIPVAVGSTYAAYVDLFP